MGYLLAISVLTNLALLAGFLVYLDRRDKREAADRQLLLNRIQAPEVAVQQTNPVEKNHERQYIPMDDDAAWWAAQNT